MGKAVATKPTLSVVGSDLRQYEANIDDGLGQLRSGFMQVAQSVGTVRALRLWEQGPNTSFENWGFVRYGWGPDTIRWWSKADGVISVLREVDKFVHLLSSVGQVRPLFSLLREPDKLVAAWTKAVERAIAEAAMLGPDRPVEVPARLVSAAVKEIKPPKSSEEVPAKQGIRRVFRSLEKQISSLNGPDRRDLLEAAAADSELWAFFEDLALKLQWVVDEIRDIRGEE